MIRPGKDVLQGEVARRHWPRPINIDEQELALSYFSQSKGGDGKAVAKSADLGAAETRFDAPAPKASASQEIVSTLGPGLLVTGNVTCTGAVQVFGRIIGDIHAARLLICKGAVVEGKVTAQEAVIEGTFKGTIHGNSVKLQATAVVDGEIFKQSLVIEQNAQFEGVSRRLEKQVEAPTADQVSGQSANHGRAPIAALVPDSVPAEQTYAVNGNGSVPAGQSY